VTPVGWSRLARKPPAKMVLAQGQQDLQREHSAVFPLEILFSYCTQVFTRQIISTPHLLISEHQSRTTFIYTHRKVQTMHWLSLLSCEAHSSLQR